MARPVRIAILGAGLMAAKHARNLQAIKGVTVVAAIDKLPDQLEAFKQEHDISQGFASIEEALAWGEFDAVCNVTPDAAHAVTTMPILAARKHVLCEKPLATNEADAQEMAERACAAGVINMINLSYRNADALQEAERLVREGQIGEVRHVEASYLQSWLTQPAWGDWRETPAWLWRLSTQHGSKGVLGDLGVHIVDFASFAAGLDVVEVSCRLATYEKALGGKIGDYPLDANDSATMQAVLENGALATITTTRFASGYLNDLRAEVFGEKGGLRVTADGNSGQLWGCLGDDLLTATWRELPCPSLPTIYERFVVAIRGEAPAVPTFERGAALQKVLDRAEQSSAQSAVNLAV